MPRAASLLALLLLTLGAGLPLGARAQATAEAGAATYVNPLPVTAGPAGVPVTSCADPSVTAGLGDDPNWYMVCTTDPLHAADRDEAGELVFHLVPTFRSSDLVRWTHIGDAFSGAVPGAGTLPDWVDPDAALWAPEIDVLDGEYVLFFAVTDTADATSGEAGCDFDAAIGVATAPSPDGPWIAQDAPLVAPRRAEPGCEFLWTFDPEVIEAEDGRRVLYYGSYFGGIEARELLRDDDGTWTAPEASAVPIALPNRYEGAEVVVQDGGYTLFASAANCCAGPQTGYAVFAARADDPFGPFLDRQGASLLEGRVGGTPVLAQNGNAWVGPGHNTLIEDRAGQWWTFYHAVEEADPYFKGEPGFTRRPVLLDRVDWIDGWPVVAGGAGPSSEPRPAPAVEWGTAPAAPVAALAPEPVGPVLPDLTDAFDAPALGPAWTWLRPPPEGDVRLGEGRLALRTQGGDLHEDSDDAPVLLGPAVPGDVAIDLRVRLDVPAEGCCHNFVQAGLVIHADDDRYLKLVVVSLWETRQIEFGREMVPMAEGAPDYGNTVLGPPADGWTWLRLVIRRGAEGETYTAHSSRDGVDWVRGGTWRHALGGSARIGLVAMGGEGFIAEFDDLIVWSLPSDGTGRED